MKKVILGIGLFTLSFAYFIPQNAMAACYEAYYPAQYCDTQGFDNCVNQICLPPPSCGPEEDCNSED